MSIFRKSNNERLVTDIKSVVTDAEAILSTTADQAGGEIAQLRGSMASRLAAVTDHLVVLEKAMAQKVGQVAKGADEVIHENPWQSALVAGGVGLLVGYLISFRRE